MTQRNVCVFLSGCFCGAVAVGIFATKSFLLFEVNLNQAKDGGSSHDSPEKLKQVNFDQLAENIDYALDGYCPVTAREETQWKLGKRQWEETHKGQVFLFASSDYRKRFREHPGRYVPVFSGNDLVLALEESRIVKGKRRHGIMGEGLVALFASESSLRRFYENPKWYLLHALDQYAEKESAQPTYLDDEQNYALDGCCPVTLMEESKWEPGNRNLTESHSGQVFLFADLEHQKRFRQQPARYMPVFLGNDVVLAKEESRTVKGDRRHGVFYRNRIFLFASEDSLRKFNNKPLAYSRYAEENQEEPLVVQPDGESADRADP